MAKILRLTDRINLKIGDVTFVLAPLNFLQKQEILGCTKNVGGQEHYDLLKAQFLYLKYCLKDIKGVKGYDNKPYELSFEGDVLTNDCVSEVLNMEERTKLNVAAWQLINGIQELRNPETGEKLEGVQLKVTSQGK